MFPVLLSTVVLSLVAPFITVEAATCDIYGYGKTPCVAAHSTTRALYDAYNGPLYQVRRAYDSATTDIKYIKSTKDRSTGVLLTFDHLYRPLGPGRTANATIQDIFCAYTTCNITQIYDQSGHGNHLTQAPPGHTAGPAAGGYDNLASATAAPISINGTKAYGLYIAPQTGYRQDKTSGIATYDQPEGIYEVIDGTHYGGCCFDYGNVEGNNQDNGPGHMVNKCACFFRPSWSDFRDRKQSISAALAASM